MANDAQSDCTVYAGTTHSYFSPHFDIGLLNLYQNNKGGDGRCKKEMRRRKRTQGRNGRNFRVALVN
jgi:hypothetical protein